jgi:uncharacterized BrkB/YihY/UPF0761 family membrane protein
VTAPRESRRVSGWDVAATSTLLVVTVAAVALATLLQLFSIAFIDYCPPETCDSTAGVVSQLVVFGAMGLVALAAVVIGVVRLVRRRRAWWVALLALAVEAALWVLAQLLLDRFTGYGWLS